MKHSRSGRIEAFGLRPGAPLAGKYVVKRKLGGGWEGEVYEIEEKRTGVQRAAKFFYPHRNERDTAVKRYARKLEKLRKCRMVIHYHHMETVHFGTKKVTCLVSELVDGELLSGFLKRQRGKRLHPFEAAHLLYELSQGLEEIHAHGEYHGDLHDGNVMIVRRGISFELKLVDFYHWGPGKTQHMRDDIVDAVRIFYDAVGGGRTYPSQPAWVKEICRGLRRDLIKRSFPTATKLRRHLECFDWG